jgi:Flp pilus assembly protein TadG
LNRQRTISLRATRTPPGRRGQALVEFALIVPILTLILLTIVQFAFVFSAQVGITNAIREAARLAAVTTPTTTVAQATANGQGVYDDLEDELLPNNVFAYNAANLVETGSPDTRVCYVSFTDTAGKPAVKVTVEGQYSHRLFIPIVAQLLDGIDGAIDGGLRVGATEEMRVENDELPASYSGMVQTCYDE